MNPLQQTAIDAVAREAWQIAEDHGFHECRVGEMTADDRTRRLMLIVSEVNEAFEEVRNHEEFPESEKIPGFTEYELELADIVIRTMDLADHDRIRLGEAIRAKMAYNKTRPYKHGKQF